MIFSPDDVTRMLKSLKRFDVRENKWGPFNVVPDAEGEFIYSKDINDLIKYLEEFKRGFGAG